MSGDPAPDARRRTWSIAVTVVLALVAAITFLLIVAGSIGYRAYRNDQWRDLREKQEILSEQLAVGLASPLWNFDHGQIERLAESSMRDENVAGIAIHLSDDGSLVHARARDLRWRQMAVATAPAQHGLMSDRREILFDGQVIGAVEVLFTPAFLAASLSQARIWLIALIVLLDLGLVLGLTVLLWRVVLRPLLQLERFALALSSEQGGIPVDPTRLRFRGELESLRASLMRMIDLLNQRYELVHASEQRYRESEERYRVLIANAPDAVLVADLDADLRFVEANDSACRLFGASREKLLTLKPIDIYSERDAEGRPTRELIAERRRQLVDGQQIEVEATIIRLDGGGERLCEVRLVTLPIQGQHLIRGSFVDITERRRIESELAQHREHLEELIAARTAELEQARNQAMQLTHAAEAANRAKSDFLSRMSHEIRTPLNAVLGYTQLLVRGGDLSPENHQAVTIINRSGEHLLALINDILEMSRIESGRSPVESEEFDLHELLENLEQLFALPARDKGLPLSVERAGDLPRHIRSDQRKVRQVLFNLLSNAVKFTASGSVVIRAGFDAVRGHLVVSVRDTGPGIPAEELPGLFQPFAQSRVGREEGRGSGLGLAICRGFASALQGEVSVASTVGEGSEFTLDIPVAVVEGGPADRPSPKKVVALAADSAKPRVLVADDHADSRRLLAHLFLSFGLEARAVGDGAAAVAVFREWRPDLVLMDIDMPVMDGLTAAAAIRREAAGRQPIIIALTAAAFDEDRKRILAGGCDEVICKPYREADLFALMERFLDVRFVEYDRSSSTSEQYIADKDLRRRTMRVPSALRRRLCEHLIVGDNVSVLRMLDEVEDEDLVRRLRVLMEAFAVERLLALLGGQGDGPGDDAGPGNQRPT